MLIILTTTAFFKTFSSKRPLYLLIHFKVVYGALKGICEL